MLGAEWTEADDTAAVLNRWREGLTIMTNETMRIEEVARFLKLDVWEVEAAIESRELPSVVLGGETLIPWRQLMKMLDPEGVAS